MPSRTCNQPVQHPQQALLAAGPGSSTRQSCMRQVQGRRLCRPTQPYACFAAPVLAPVLTCAADAQRGRQRGHARWAASKPGNQGGGGAGSWAGDGRALALIRYSDQGEHLRG